MDELLCRLSLTQIPHIGDVQARLLVQYFGDARSVFQASLSELLAIEGIGEIRARSINRFRDFAPAEKEIAFLEKYRIRTLFLTDPAYPQRLLHCYDAPVLLFFKGEANLNASRILAIVGTRGATEYGRQFTAKLVEELEAHQVMIVSGLALGIDSYAHKAALKYQIPTVGVVGHGLDSIYPPSNASLAKEMVQQGGGILSEFFSGTPADRHHFPLRNRIVAGLCDATIVVETHIKGGSMITAKLADSYNRDVFALPGRTTDNKSSGCHYLIRNHRANLLTEAKDLLELMGWDDKKPAGKAQRTLFIELTEQEQMIVDLLQGKEHRHIDEINLLSGLSSSAIAAAMLNLELQNVVQSLPGKLYRLT
ncbi:MAG TPA: DNA-processing protein DprA [Flavisolibacter sp.]|nr:DNA-processing protein DprA [Flavisolibacter sp.]